MTASLVPQPCEQGERSRVTVGPGGGRPLESFEAGKGTVRVAFVVLALALAGLTFHAWQRSAHVTDGAIACDPFGYLAMARSVRVALAEGRAPDYAIETGHTRALIEHFQAEGVALERWDELVAPHAHHYFPEADHVAAQYPPGTAAVLALFEEGRAAPTLTRIAMFATSALGLLWLAWAARRGSLVGMAYGALACTAVLAVIFRAPRGGYSLFASAPIALAAVLATLAAEESWERRRGLAVALAVAAGLLAGSLVTLRVTSVLLLPAFALALRPRLWPPLALGGAVPGLWLAWHQHQVAGAWYLTTYNRGDTAAASLAEILAHNVPFYLLGGRGSGMNPLWVGLLVGLVGLWLVGFDRAAVKRAALLLGVALGPSLGFLLTHRVTMSYYAYVSALVAVLLAAGSVALADRRPAFRVRLPVDWRALFVVMALAPAIVTSVWGLSRVASRPRPGHVDLVGEPVPEELRDERAWLWADHTSGSFWFYAGRPAYKVMFSDPEVRADLFRWVSERGEPQYVVVDSGLLEKLLVELESIGARNVLRGEVYGYPYYRVCFESEAGQPGCAGEG